MIYPGIRSEVGSAIRTAHDRVTAAVSLDAQFAAFMASLTDPRALFDPSRASSRFQDAAASTLVTADGQPFARLNDSSGAGNHVSQSVAASMPLYRTDGTLSWAQPDGVNDCWQSLANFNLSTTDKVTAVFGVRVLNTSTRVLAELTTNAEVSLSGFNCAVVGGSFYGRAAPPTTAIAVSASGSAVGDHVVRVVYDRASSATYAIQIFVDGVLRATAPVGGLTGNFASAILYLFARSGPSLLFDGRFYGAMFIGRLLTINETALCERWMASKTGVVL